MSFRDEWLRGCEPEPDDGPFVLKLKAELASAFPEPPGEVIYLPASSNQLQTELSGGVLKRRNFPDQSLYVVDGVGARRQRRPYHRAKRLLDSLLGTHKATLSRHVARVKLRAVLRAFWRALACAAVVPLAA